MSRADLLLWIIFTLMLVNQSIQWFGWYVVQPDDIKLSDYTLPQDKMLMVNLAKELLIDAKLSQRQIMFVRKKHRPFLDYEVGLIMGKIREKYKRMMDIYMEATNVYTNKTNFTAPGRDFPKPLHHIIYMEQVHTHEVEIDRLIRILEDIPPETLSTVIPPGPATKPTTSTSRTYYPNENSQSNSTLTISSSTTSSSTISTSTLSTLPDRKLRAEDEPPETKTPAPPSIDPLPEPEFENEYEVKQYNREKYERKIGHNINWTLDEYYGF